MAHISMNDRSLGDLVGNLGRDIVGLVRGEINLARAEADEGIKRIIGALVTIGVGLALAIAALVILLQAAVAALANVWEPWLASLVVGVVAVAIGGMLAMTGKNKLNTASLAPRRTRENLKRDSDLVKEHAR